MGPGLMMCNRGLLPNLPHRVVDIVNAMELKRFMP
jgi:hypothetical protein